MNIKGKNNVIWLWNNWEKLDSALNILKYDTKGVIEEIKKKDKIYIYIYEYSIEKK